MILRPFRRGAERRTIASLYGMIVAQARQPVFYVPFGVPDTVQGRFDLIVLHLVLLVRRLDRAGDRGRLLGQGLFDAFCRDLDGNLREMGIGDLAVPKHMRRFGEAFYGRQSAYLAALDSPDAQAFENALARNILAKCALERAADLARYARALVGALDNLEESALMRGQLVFPSPRAFANANEQS